MTVLCIAAWAFVSLCLITHLWFTHRRDSTLRKLIWSLALLVPLAGWVFYGGFYRPPHADSSAGQPEDGGFGQW